MDFLFYLSPQSLEIYKLISQKIRVVENAPLCQKYNIYGWFNSKQKLMTFCTDRIKSGRDVEYDVNETLLHESVHVAQSCKVGFGYTESFGISKSIMPITDRRKNDVNAAVKLNGEQVRHIEHEAFWMEDKPDKVKYVLRKYCF